MIRTAECISKMRLILIKLEGAIHAYEADRYDEREDQEMKKIRLYVKSLQFHIDNLVGYILEER